MSPKVDTEMFKSLESTTGGPEKTTGSPFAFLTALGIGFLIVAGATTGGVFTMRKLTENNIEKLESEIAKYRETLELTSVREMLRLDSRIAMAVNLLAQHTDATVGGVFDVLEYYTIEGVRFTTFSYTPSSRTLTLTADAKNDLIFAEQLAVFEKSGFFSNVSFDSLSISAQQENIGFTLTLTFSKTPPPFASRFGEDSGAINPATESNNKENNNE